MIYLAFLFGVVEGVTEFLPISSTAHLRLLKPLFHIPLDDSYWKMFDVVIQFGAVMCLPVYFRQRIVQLLKTFPKAALIKRMAPLSIPRRMQYLNQ